MEKYKFEGKNEETLLKQALEELSCEESDIIYTMSEQKGGLLKAKKYIIEIIRIQDVADYGKELIDEFLKGFKLNGNVETRIREKQISYKLFTDNNSIIIGRGGHILEALQVFVKQAIYNHIDMFANVIIDVENYKEKQDYYLERDVKKIAREVTISKVDVKLDPMNSYDRRVIHNALSGFDYIETTSEGEEPNRYVVIKYKGKK